MLRGYSLLVPALSSGRLGEPRVEETVNASCSGRTVGHTGDYKCDQVSAPPDKYHRAHGCRLVPKTGNLAHNLSDLRFHGSSPLHAGDAVSPIQLHLGVGSADLIAGGRIGALGLSTPVIVHRGYRFAENSAHFGSRDKFARGRRGESVAVEKARKDQRSENNTHEKTPLLGLGWAAVSSMQSQHKADKRIRC
jgi:hypothetical protein